MKRFFLSFLFMIFLSPSFGQNDWPPVGAFWNYQGDFATHNGYLVDAEKTIYIQRDTLINGETRKIYRNVGYTKINYFDSVLNVDERWDYERCCYYLRNDTFYLDDYFGNTLELFFLNQNVGDSSVNYYQGRWYVDSLQNEIIGTDTFNLTVYKADCGSGIMRGITIEDVGPLNIEATLHPDGVCNIGGFSTFEWHFTCYNGGGIEYPAACDPLQTGIETAKERMLDFSTYPNPARNELNIEIPVKGIYQFNVTSLKGQILSKGQIESEFSTIDIAGIPTGTYLLTISDGITRKGQRLFLKK